ncbi:MAG: 1-acyl-sn-glycerol-3-phosphate acyltransferase, partial [Rhodothermales bacterium]|nr:1-acyl-sn-glycerol-3-phosphate acyltransferase [Rhodothermales bacterium]
MIASLWIWITTVFSLVIALPAVGLTRIFGRDPVHYRAGRLFRMIGSIPTRLTPLWRITVEGTERVKNPRNPYVVVSNHQSLVDIPVISRLPWEMKWVAKKELFDVPLIGWLMKWAGDIAVDRKNKRSRAM